MNNISEKVQIILHLLDEVVAGRMNPEEALKVWPDPDNTDEKMIASSWHQLSHYVADIDICTKDVEYDFYMKGLLRKGAGEIREKYREQLSR